MTITLPAAEKAELHELAELRAELDAYRGGHDQLTIDPIHPGQPVVEIYEYAEGESSYWLQQTHQNMPMFFCMVCQQITLGKPSTSGTYVRPVTGCGKCGTDHPDDLSPRLYEQKAVCRSWSANHGGQYDGACLIAGSDGCNCPEAS